MLHSAKALSRYEVHASDGKLGRAVDAYFDGSTKKLCYFVVDTGRWLPDKTLLIDSVGFGVPDRDRRVLPVGATCEQIEHCCQTAEREFPVSWRQEELLRARYGGFDTRGGPPFTSVLGSARREALAHASGAEGNANPKLHSLREVLGYQIEATDGPLGVAEDLLIDHDGWVIRYLVVDTKSWKPGREVLVPPQWIETVSWGERRIHVRLSRQKVKTSQRADPSSHLSKFK